MIRHLSYAALNRIRFTIHMLKIRFNNPTAIIQSKTSVDSNSDLGNFVKLHSRVSLADTKLGRYSYVGSDSFIQNTNIGSFCSIGSLVRIGLPSHPTHYISTSPLFYDMRLFKGSKVLFKAHNPAIKALTIIGSDVWIGENVLILAGVTVGTGAVIGAGSVVTKDVRPYSIVVGNPAREIRTRFPEETIDRILGTKWWEKDDTYLSHVARHYDDVTTFLDQTNHF